MLRYFVKDQDQELILDPNVMGEYGPKQDIVHYLEQIQLKAGEAKNKYDPLLEALRKNDLRPSNIDDFHRS